MIDKKGEKGVTDQAPWLILECLATTKIFWGVTTMTRFSPLSNLDLSDSEDESAVSVTLCYFWKNGKLCSVKG